jgi:hypothetical protein
MAVNRRLHGSPSLKTLQDADAYPDSARTDATQSSSSQTSKYKAIISTCSYWNLRQILYAQLLVLHLYIVKQNED